MLNNSYKRTYFDFAFSSPSKTMPETMYVRVCTKYSTYMCVQYVRTSYQVLECTHCPCLLLCLLILLEIWPTRQCNLERRKRKKRKEGVYSYKGDHIGKKCISQIV